uniref:NADH-ubiquinone oxidoreductase chain 2 n=1 Tax=Staphylinidae sp. BMNH 1274665 TaxID=1796589 RepID=A0A126TE94_9COLE|nr:NADH dehydrogenase subunit 2 [Staphylinidae sp. BMNH 1274665]
MFHYKMFFLIILMMSSLISISSSTWMGMWLGLEMNLLAFIPLMQENNKPLTSESSIKYFLTQALASTLLLFSMILLSKNFLIMKNINNTIMIMFNSMLLMKMGMAPFHFWFPEVMEGLSWNNCLILMTWQKITPMILIMYNFSFSYFFSSIIIYSMLISSFLGINQISLRKMLTFSSINHMAWMLSTMLFSEIIWKFYFIIYMILNLNMIMIFKFYQIFVLNQLFNLLQQNFLLKFLFSLNFLSLGGLPPFIGFFPKWLTIQFMIQANWIYLSFLMVLLTLLTLFFYMRLIYNFILFNHSEMKFSFSTKNNYFFLIMLNMMTLFSLILFSIYLNF